MAPSLYKNPTSFVCYLHLFCLLPSSPYPSSAEFLALDRLYSTHSPQEPFNMERTNVASHHVAH